MFLKAPENKSSSDRLSSPQRRWLSSSSSPHGSHAAAARLWDLPSPLKTRTNCDDLTPPRGFPLSPPCYLRDELVTVPSWAAREAKHNHVITAVLLITHRVVFTAVQVQGLCLLSLQLLTSSSLILTGRIDC